MFTSPRSLLAIVRLSTAFDRLRLADVVEEPDINAALHLYNCCRDSIEGVCGDSNSILPDVLQLVNVMAKEYKDVELSLAEILHKAREAGMNETDVNAALDELDKYEVIVLKDEQVTLL